MSAEASAASSRPAVLPAEGLALLVVDVQERLAAAMDKRAFANAERNILNLLELCRLHSIPVIATEQYPKGLGPTCSPVRDALGSAPKLEKLTFSAAAAEGMVDRLRAAHASRVVVTGMEAHVCVYQTVLDLVALKFEVIVPKDSVVSRHEHNLQAALDLMREAGAHVTTTETLIFRVLGRAGTDAFRVMSKLLK